MLRAGLGLCLLMGCWAIAGADQCDINAGGTSTCAGSEETALLQSRAHVSIDDADSPAMDSLRKHVYGPFKHDKSILDYFKHLYQNAVDARLARIIPDDGNNDELEAISSDSVGDESVLETDSDLESDLQTLSAISASELLQAEIKDTCPHQAALLIERSNQMEYKVVHAEAADNQGVRHTVLKGKNGQLQYIASKRVNGENLALIADPPACSGGPLATLQTDSDISSRTRQIPGKPHLVSLDSSLVADCKTLFKRTVAEGCNNKQIDVKALRAEVGIIDGIDVKMNVQVCKPGTEECHPHLPECAFETSLDHTDAKLLQFSQALQTDPPVIQAEKDGLQATLKLKGRLCDVDEQDGTTLK